MSNFSPFFDFARICPIFCSSWFWKHFTVLQSWTKRLEKTKHEQHKNHLLTISLLLILPTILLSPTLSPYAMTTEHRQTKNHSLTVSPFLILPQLLLPPPPPPYAMLIWEVMLARKLFVTQKTTLSWGGGGGGMWWFACLPLNALGRVILL